VDAAPQDDGLPLLVLQHRPWEHPGLVGAAVSGMPVVTRSVLDEPRDTLPSAGALGGVVVMGGPMGALDDDRHPGLAHERRLLADAVAADVPVLGVCLGMQLLGAALGGVLTPGAAREIGFGRLELSPGGATDRVLSPLADGPHGPVVLHWHGDTVSLPSGATMLASTSATPVQAFRAGSAVGLQFHLEVGRAQLDEWLATPEMTEDLTPEEVGSIRADGARVLPDLLGTATAVFSSFADAVRARRG